MKSALCHCHHVATETGSQHLSWVSQEARTHGGWERPVRHLRADTCILVQSDRSPWTGIASKFHDWMHRARARALVPPP